MADLERLRFVRPFHPYNAGEVAGFSPETARRIVATGSAVREGAGDPSPVPPRPAPPAGPVHRDPTPVHRDPPAPSGPQLPEDFPHRDLLEAAGIETVDDLETARELGPLTEIPGVGRARAARIEAALEELA